MHRRRKIWIIIFLSLASISIHLYSFNELRVENGYSTHFYRYFSRFLRHIFGLFPFSIGDIFYGLLVIFLLWKLGRFLRFLFKKAATKRFLRNSLYQLFVFLGVMYIIFNLLWGINYNRKGIAWQLGLTMESYTSDDLRLLNEVLLQKVNDSRDIIPAQKIEKPSKREMFNTAATAYEAVARQYPYLQNNIPSVKPSLWGWLGNYTGFTGYYNPFTGEAQVNTTVPGFLQPFITCHEIAHQIGYAKEMEANFVGYLAASHSSDPLLRYSVYLDLFVYANRNLGILDSAYARQVREQLHPNVRSDLEEWIRFNRKHQSWVEPVVRWVYGIYLQGNKQPNGVLSYDEVTAFIIAYYKKFGKI